MKNIDKWQGKQFLYGKIVVFLMYEVLSEVSLERDRSRVAGNMDGSQEIEGRWIIHGKILCFVVLMPVFYSLVFHFLLPHLPPPSSTPFLLYTISPSFSFLR